VSGAGDAHGATRPMKTEKVELPRAIDADLAADIEKQGVYVSPHVHGIKVQDDGKSVLFDLDDGADVADARAKMGKFLIDMVQKFRKLARKVLVEHARKSARPLERGVYEELKRRRWVLELGRGQVGLAGPALALVRTLDDECSALGKADFGAIEQTYPALIPASVLGRCGYFASFPQAVSMVTHLVEDYDLIEEFRQANAASPELTIPNAGALPTPEACLVPAVCYHCYQSLEGQTLGDLGHLVTSMGKCFRYESSNIVGLDRLWDFTMREIIFVGTEALVTARRQKAIEAVTQQLARWDLDGAIETANDPFFPTTYATKTYWQHRSDLKFELRLAIEPSASGDARTLACGSFNLHENFFGKTFGITASNGEPAFTGCVGWGLERWVLACFTQHGYDAKDWPEWLRARIFG
jgi:seryl-tRNA synthetase